MDFLRIRQKARERAREREERQEPPRGASPSAAPASSPAPAIVAEPPLPGSVPAAVAAEAADRFVGDVLPSDLSELEAALRAELVGGEDLDAREVSPPADGDEEPDPLDEFFWREDETAPRLPDLVAATELPIAEPPPPRREWLTFLLGSEEYGLEIHHVREVLKPPPLTEVPRAPGHILGVIMVRGEVVAVVDPRIRLGLPRTERGPRARILVCDTGDARCGVLVDAVSHVIRLAPSAIESRPPGVGGVSAEYIAGIGRQRNRIFILLDAPTLLGDALAVRSAGAPS